MGLGVFEGVLGAWGAGSAVHHFQKALVLAKPEAKIALDQGTSILAHSEVPEAIGAASSSGTALARELGVAGEEATGIVKNTARIDSLSGARAFRIPDGLTETTLTEVKNVAELSFSRQLQDSLHFALMTGRDFVLKVRPTTSLSQPLRDAIEAGYIILEFLP